MILNLAFVLIGGFVVAMFLASLAAWGWVGYGLLRGTTILEYRPRLLASWGFGEVIACGGIYILIATLLFVGLRATGVLGPAPQPAGPNVAAAGDGDGQAPPLEANEMAAGTAGTAEASPNEATKDERSEGNANDADTDAGADRDADGDAEASDDADGDAASGAEPKPPVNLDQKAVTIRVDSIAKVTAVFLTMLLLTISDPWAWRRVGWIPHREDFILGALGTVMLLPPMFLLQTLLTQIVPYEHEVMDLLTSDASIGLLVTLSLTTIVVAPLTEEFFFRGLLQGWLQQLSMRLRNRRPQAQTFAIAGPAEATGAGHEASADGPIPAAGVIRPRDAAAMAYWPMLVSSLLFALAHWGQGPAPITLFFLALGLGFLYRLSGSLWPCIMVHAVLNGLSTAVMLLTAFR